ncbi:MAG: crossover junction endodeoxyribonuclease RuvC [Sedimentisphaerales bacterium]|jgi:crossover junction endodeoxyribonuclease RuvC
MRILGIDPGLQVCGYACIESKSGETTLLEGGVIRTTASKTIETRLNQIAEDIDSILDKFKPDVVGVEQLYSHYAHPRTAILMGHARGVILQRCAEAGVEVKSFGATRIKKCITGNGHASKEQMQRTIKTLLGLSAVPEPNDVADAIAAAMCCAETMRINPRINSGAKQL